MTNVGFDELSMIFVISKLTIEGPNHMVTVPRSLLFNSTEILLGVTDGL